MKIIMSCDHAGPGMLEYLQGKLKESGYEVEIPASAQALTEETKVDYPDMAKELAHMVADTQGEAMGILICGTGIGMAMAANKVPGIRAANVTNELCAALARRHNDANVLCLGARIIGPELAWAITHTFLETSFEGGRHQRRVNKIDGTEESKS